MRYKILAILLTLVLAISCTGKRGPTGPQGPPGVGQTGPQGPIGPAGGTNSVYYYGSVPDEQVFCLPIRECAVSYPDTVMAIFAWVGDPDLYAWQLLPGYDTENLYARWFEYASETSGCVGCFVNCQGLPYYVLVILK